MTAETESEFAKYITDHYEFFGLRMDFGPSYRKWFTPYYDHSEAKCIVFDMPNKPSAFAYLSTALPSLLPNYELVGWNGGAVWYQDYDVWNHQGNVAGWKMIERIRAGYGELRPFSTATVNHFRDDDLAILPAFLLAPLVYGWDAYYIPSKRGSYAHISHDEVWKIYTETNEDFEKVQEALATYSEDHWIRKNRVMNPAMFPAKP